MANLGMMFDAMQVDPQGMSQSLPVSDSKGHVVMITESEMKGSKNDQNNGYLDLTLEVIDGEHKGASGHYRINLYHSNEKTVEIAKRQLSAVCHAVNVFQITDSAMLHNIPFRAVVGYQKLTPEQEAAKARGEEVVQYTEVKGVLCADGSQPGKAKNAANAPVQPQAQPTTPAAPAQPQQAAPWGAPAPQQQQQEAPAQQAAPWAQNPTATGAAPWAK